MVCINCALLDSPDSLRQQLASRIGAWRDLGCTGVAAVQMDAEGDTEQVVAWGPQPTTLPFQRRIARAALYVVLLVLRICPPPFRVHVGCATVLSGVTKGRRWCTSSKRPPTFGSRPGRRWRTSELEKMVLPSLK